MGMPQIFEVVIACDRGNSSMLAASALENSWGIDFRPDIKPYVYASTFYGYEKIDSLIFDAFRKTQRKLIPKIPTHLIDPRSVDLWLTIGHSTDKYIQRRIIDAGPAPDGFYRNVFPQPVMELRIPIPPIPNKENQYNSYFDKLESSMKQWKDRLLKAFYDSS